MSLDTWAITNERCDPQSLGQFNSVFAVSNGYLGLKGNLQEDRDGYCPVTIIHGIYDELDMFGLIRPSKHERRWLDPDYFDTAGRSPAVANLPDPLFVQVFVGDREVSLGRGRVSAFRQHLDLRCGLYHYTYDYDDGLRTMRIESWRFAALRHPHRVYMRYRITAGAPGQVRILSGINGRVHSNTTRERQFAIVDLAGGADGACRLHVRTPARQHDVELAVINRASPAAGPGALRAVRAHDSVYASYEFSAERGQALTLDRFVALSSSEDARHSLAQSAAAEATAAARQGFDAALDEQRAAWAALWERADVGIEGDNRAQQYLRFCLYHLLAAAPRFTDRLSVPVKLLTGEYYQGNTFYDTDTYIVPFYTFTLPEYGRTCLTYRHRGLTPGRALARELGCAGAKLAWQAGPYGEECLGRWYRFVHTNIHINADVAYSLMQYYWATGDDRFMRTCGLEMLVESARFYASRATYDASRDAYDLRDVAGPDEAHCASTNNFYTNYLAAHTLRWAAGTLEQLRAAEPPAAEEAIRQLQLRADEAPHWRHVAERLTLRFDPQTMLYEQCDGFYQLPPPPADLLERRLDWFVPLARYQALNQPDVLMAMMLFRDAFPAEVRRANWEYYQDKSLNFSSMSFAINAILAADVGALDEAYRHFITCAGVDLDEALTGRHDTHAGLHGTALGGAWMAAVFGFGGVHLSERGLRVNPNLPPQWSALRFPLVLHGVPLKVTVERQQVVLEAGPAAGAAPPITVAGRMLSLRSGESRAVPYRV